MAKEARNLGASVRARLLQISKEKEQSFELILTRYAIERLLYRLAQSPQTDRFVLKGGMLLMTWFDEPFRATRDVDFRGYGDPALDVVLHIFKELFSTDLEDGVRFDADGARVSRIRDENEYGGLRIRTTADIDGARIVVNVDVGFGDATEPGVEMLDYPVLLDMPMPRLRGYARETIVAEKFHAMVALGLINSRMKDYFDLWTLSNTFDFDQSRLAKAISATFAQRGTAIPDEVPDALTSAFAADATKQPQWESVKRDLVADPGSLHDVVSAVASFLMPAAISARKTMQ